MKKKIAVALVAFALVLCFAIGGTFAWLTAKTAPVKNTFTYGDIDITLTETTGAEYKMVPGVELAKDPKVTVLKNSEACWLFVKIEKSTNYSTYLADYTVADGWTALTGVTGVYYREVPATGATTDASYYVLKGDTTNPNGYVTVKDGVTKAQMEALKNGTDDEPTLTFTAYAVQKDGNATAADAWAKLS